MYIRSMTLVFGLLLATFGVAKEIKIEMLNYGPEGGMVFQPSFVRAELGDIVTFVPTHAGHYAQSYVVPEGQSAWKSTMNQPFSITLSHEGVHLYYCPPHLMMGMVGMIQVGKPANLEVINAKVGRLKSKVALKPERVDALMEQIQE
ncbi:pseudoazurin [Marinomonas mediterranea]|jgi:pseudoazurin|uniref:Pseudoazurin n=1 Tax=Marinomonas mediterranea (strain ATCC 700492 / JCM 21426 / NBRC 103028 / MMB-1) TaxID=717774 RepID=F2JVM8_MARM1|nr:pseudoazurin [Marinomonas mediterranea]ADZ90572.1 pseudoazurin [Marinomonas mediterranea MMB-1]WCN12673.1 pseudoazurin [Marinomonas mediterranea]WCN16747.1 pseudoazurin [Marinomonas mediterranea MMB-1]